MVFGILETSSLDKKTIFVLLIFSLICSNLYAEESDNFNLCSKAYHEQSLDSAKQVCTEVKKRAAIEDDAVQNLAITRTLIKIYIKLGNHQLVEQLFDEARLLVLLDDERHEIVRDQGIYYYQLGEYSKAEHYFLEGLKLAKKLEEVDIAKSLNDLGLIKLRQLNYEESLTYFHQSLKIKETLQLEEASAVTIRNIALVYYRLNDNKKALTFYLDALERYQKVLLSDPSNKGMLDRILHMSTDLAAVYSRLGDQQNSQNLIEEVFFKIKKLKDTTEKRSRYIDLAEGLIEGKDYAVAKSFLEKAKKLLPNNNQANNSRLNSDGSPRIYISS